MILMKRGLRRMKVFAPGKLILSGEHAVVHGYPALAMAINKYVIATITHDAMPTVSVDLANLAHQSSLNIQTLRGLKERIKRKYRRFMRGEYSIKQVLQKPFELAQFAISLFAEKLHPSLPNGVSIHVQSDIPIGCGLGSSAATILSVMQAMSIHLEAPLAKEQLFQLALVAEKMQHGFSSGLDLKIALEGGCIYVEGDKYEKRAVPTFPMYLVQTGTPLTTTGQCVEKSSAFFKANPSIGDAFASVTKEMDVAICTQSQPGMLKALRQNHQLLIQIGVVPIKAQTFIAEVEMLGGAGKVCGAGSITGDPAGFLLVVADELEKLTSLCEQFHYQLFPIQGESRGIYVL
jgi:mevalonate kinase